MGNRVKFEMGAELTEECLEQRDSEPHEGGTQQQLEDSREAGGEGEWKQQDEGEQEMQKNVQC
jgi:hypothetical protein